ncbi:MAG: ankyrin repeat domain-containing protein [Cyanobacteria bacterium J06648_16]
MQAFFQLCASIAWTLAAMFLVGGSLNVLFDLDLAFKVVGSAEALPTDFAGVFGLTALALLIGAGCYAIGNAQLLLKLARRHRWPLLGGVVLVTAAIAVWIASALPELRLEMALTGGNSTQAQTLLQKHEYSGEVLNEMLYWSLKSEDFASTEMMLAQGADINHRRGEFDSTLLHSAVLFFPISATRFLIDNGIDVNAKDAFDRNALHDLLTSRARNLESSEAEILSLTQQLTNAGTDTEAVNSFGKTPLTIAQEQDYETVVAHLEMALTVSASD